MSLGDVGGVRVGLNGPAGDCSWVQALNSASRAACQPVDFELGDDRGRTLSQPVCFPR